MTKNIVLLVTIMIWLSLTASPPSFSQPPAKRPIEFDETVKAQSEALKSQTDQLKSQNEALKAQLEVMRHFDQRLVATVYWALGAFVTMILALFGFNWFSTQRNYDRDKAAMALELRAGLQTEMTQQRAQLDARLSAFREVLDKSVTDSATTASKAAQIQLEKLQPKLDEIDRELKETKYNSLVVEARYWEDKTPPNAMMFWADCLEFVLQEKAEWQINAALKGIDTVLKAITTRELSILTSHVSRMNGLLDRVPPKHSIQVKELKILLEKTVRF